MYKMLREKNEGVDKCVGVFCNVLYYKVLCFFERCG